MRHIKNSVYLVRLNELVFVNITDRGAWVVQSVKRLTLVQVTISQFVGSSPALGSCADSAEPAWDPLSLSFLCALPPLSLSLKLNK